MSINKKAFYLLTILIISLLMVQGIFFTLMQIKTDSQIENKEMQINKNIEKEVENRLKESINNIAMNVVVLEEEIDKNMLNAAYLLQNMDQREKITDEQLKQITTITQMSDLYLTDENGVFIQSTEEKALGISLYHIWDGYKMLMTGESTYLPSTIKIKEETGEIFKFTAIPRFGSKGIIETALNAKIFEENLKRNITKENGIQSLYLIDGSGLVLTESVKNKEKSKWKIGQSIKDEKIGKIIQTKKTTIEIKNGQAEIYAPVIKNNQVIYVLYSVVDTENYFSNAKIMKQSLWDMKLQIKSNTYLIIVILFVLSIVVLFILSILIKKFVEPLVKMSEITKKLILGDLTVEKINLNNKDEIGTLARTFNHMISALREAFSKMDANAKQLSSFSEQVSASTESNKFATNQITIIMQEAANGAIVQAKKSEESKQLTNETNLFNSLIKKKCETVLSSSTQTEKEAKTGNEIVKKTMEQIKVLNESVEKVNCVTNRLNQRSKEIELIIETIDNIASQTELLALNAGIEAARSGEQGKGFAVIAHEVKKLADDSKKSTIQISALVKEIQKDTSEAVHTMDIHTEEMKMGTRLINQSGVIFENIVNEVENITQQIKEVSSTSEKMTEIVEKVNDSVSNIHDIANESSKKFNNVVAGTEEQLSVMEEIHCSMKHLKEMANELEAVISKYKY